MSTSVHVVLKWLWWWHLKVSPGWKLSDDWLVALIIDLAMFWGHLKPKRPQVRLFSCVSVSWKPTIPVCYLHEAICNLKANIWAITHTHHKFTTAKRCIKLVSYHKCLRTFFYHTITFPFSLHITFPLHFHLQIYVTYFTMYFLM